MVATHFVGSLAAIVLVSAAFHPESACSCFPVTPAGSYERNVSVHKVRVLSAFYGKDGKKRGPQNPFGVPKYQGPKIVPCRALIPKATTESKF